MQYVTVQGEEVPALGLGTWELDGSDCRRAVAEALELGYRHIDTAQGYGNEGEIGQVLGTAPVDRGEIFLATKIDNSNHAPDAVRRSTEESLRRLGTDYVDLLLVHWPVEFRRLPATLEAMRGLHDDGKVRHLGVSNFTPPQLERALELAPIFCDQVEFHPFLAQSSLLELARKHDFMLTAYSPLARGAALADAVLAEIADRHHKHPAQVVLRWLLDHENVAAVPKASSRAHLESNLAVFDFSLSGEEREQIAGLDRRDRIIDPPFAPDWER